MARVSSGAWRSSSGPVLSSPAMPAPARVAYGKLLGGAAAVSAALLSLTRIGDYDIWYHLRAGRLFLESGLRLPATDPFAYTATSQPLSVQSWLAGVIYHLAERAGGIPGVQLFNAAVVAATFAVLFATTRLFSKGRGDAGLSAILVLLAAFAARFRLGARPHVLEFLLLAIDLYVLQRLRTRGRAPLWVLPLVQLAWVNIHGSHLLGIALPFLFLLGEAAQRLVPARWRADATADVPVPRLARTLAIVGAANALATLANPQGWRALQFPFLVAGMRGYMARIGEWQPMSWDLLAGFGAHYTWAFSALAVLALVALATSRRVAVTDLLLLVVFGALAARGVRLAPEFAIATVPGTFAALAPVAVRVARGREEAVAWGAVAALLVALGLSPFDRAYEYGFGKKERIFPDRAVEFAERAGVSGPLFNSFAFGDYLVHRAPDRKVFIHGRNEVFPEEFYEEYLDAHRDAATFRRLVERWGIEWILLEYTLTDYGQREAMRHLEGSPEWAPIYWDRVSALYVRTTGPNAAVAARDGFRIVRPSWFDFAYLDGVVASGLARAALGELQVSLERAPDNEEAWLARAYLCYRIGARDAAADAINRALAINPDRAMTHSALGQIALERGDGATARARFERALDLDPGDTLAVEGLRKLGVAVTAVARPAGHP